MFHDTKRKIVRVLEFAKGAEKKRWLKFKDRDDLYALTIAPDGGLAHKNIMEDPEVSFYVEYGKILNQNKMVLVGRNGREKRLSN